MSAETASPPIRRLDALSFLRSETFSGFIVLVGALMSGGALAVDYFSFGQAGFGAGQVFSFVGGFGLMMGGAAIEVLAGRRTLADTLKFALIAMLVAAIMATVNLYNIENRAFFELLTIVTLFGFIASHYLPAKARAPFFVILSLGAITGVFGAVSIVPALWLIGLGVVLFVIAQARLPLIVRIAVLSAIAVVLAFVRVSWIEIDGLSIVLPVLASMFIFRLPIFLYDLHNKKGPTGLWSRLGYFFMMPNAVFPFFPVVDFTTFGRSAYNEEALRIYRRGAIWMLRGLVHLILYRVVNMHFVITPESVSNPAEFLQFIVANFALYLRISGSFHMVIGLMMLFGFNLPETHTRFYFSTSFIDFWRRINIYWKDFMQKMIFNPSYLRLKNAGLSHHAAITIGMFAVFFGTWALHAYYWFWLRGTFLFVPQDIAFWALLALFLVTQTLLEARGHVADASYLLGPKVSLVVRTVCTFMSICLLWSLWTTENVMTWLEVWRSSGLAPALAGGEVSAGAWGATILTVMTVGAMLAITMGVSFGVVAPVPATTRRVRKKKESDFAIFPIIGAAAACVIVLAGLQVRAVSALAGQDGVQFAASISEPRLNAHDREALERGYYEGLTNVNNFNSALWQIYMTRPNAQSEVRGMAGIRQRDDYLAYEYLPGSVSQYNNVEYRINRWGMRDKDFELAKPAGTYRIAVIGASRAVGWSVEYEERFTTHMERILNEKDGSTTTELLNFSVDGYQPLDRLITFEEKALKFSPDAAIYIGGSRDPVVDRMAERISDGIALPYEFQREMAQRAGVKLGMSREQIIARLDPYVWDMVGGVYRRFVETSRANGITPIFVYLPEPFDNSEHPEPAMPKMVQTARDAGFHVIDLIDLWKGRDPSKLTIAEWDGHPNPAGHKIIADELSKRVLMVIGDEISQRGNGAADDPGPVVE